MVNFVRSKVVLFIGYCLSFSFICMRWENNNELKFFLKTMYTKFEWLLLTEVCTCEYSQPSRIGNLYSYGNMIYFYTLVYTINTHCYNFICVLACCTVQGKRCLTLILNIYVVFTILFCFFYSVYIYIL